MLSFYGAQDNFSFKHHRVVFYKFSENKKYIFVLMAYGFGSQIINVTVLSEKIM